VVTVQRPANCGGEPLIMIGKTYLERGKPVVVLVRWGKGGGTYAYLRASMIQIYALRYAWVYLLL
jgi:hypothetical protein